MASIDPNLLGLFAGRMGGQRWSLLDLVMALSNRQSQRGGVVSGTAGANQPAPAAEPAVYEKELDALEKELELRRKILVEQRRRGGSNKTTSSEPQRYRGADGRNFITNQKEVAGPEDDAIERLLGRTAPSIYRRKLR